MLNTIHARWPGIETQNCHVTRPAMITQTKEFMTLFRRLFPSFTWVNTPGKYQIEDPLALLKKMFEQR